MTLDCRCAVKPHSFNLWSIADIAGVGYTGLSGKVLYPMVSSTAARTGMRLIKACSFQTSLQFLCCQVLREMVPSHLDVIDELKMPPGLQAFLTNNLSWLLRPNELSDNTTLPQRNDTNVRKRTWSRRFPMETASSSDEEDAIHSVRGSSRYKRRRKEGYLRTDRPQADEEEEYEDPSSSEESSRDNACEQSGSQHSRSWCHGLQLCADCVYLNCKIDDYYVNDME